WLPFADLRNGENAFSYTSSLQTASVYSKELPASFSAPFLPLSMAVMGGIRCTRAPWPLLRQCDGGGYSLIKAAQQDLDNGPVIELAFATQDPKTQRSSLRERFFLDVQRGYLPKQALLYFPDGETVAEHAYLKERWSVARTAGSPCTPSFC